MIVIVNGKPMELPPGLTVDGLLSHLKVRREFTAVALNREVTLRSQYAETPLKEGDKVEIRKRLPRGQWLGEVQPKASRADK